MDQTEQEALTAIAQGKGKLIHGRPCRTERAKVPRKLYTALIKCRLSLTQAGTFYVCRRDGSILLIEEGEAALARHGVAVAHSWYPDEQTKLLHNLTGGFFVQLKFYDDGRQAQQVRTLSEPSYLINQSDIGFRQSEMKVSTNLSRPPTYSTLQSALSLFVMPCKIRGLRSIFEIMSMTEIRFSSAIFLRALQKMISACSSTLSESLFQPCFFSALLSEIVNVPRLRHGLG